MPDLTTEKGVLAYLGIPDFRHMNKDTVMRFASIVNDVNPEVTKRVIDQYPQFASVLNEALEEDKELARRAIESNDSSMRDCAAASSRVFDGYDELLKNPNYSFEQKMQVLSRMEAESERSREKDSENKQFLLEQQKLRMAALVVVSAASFLFLGGKLKVKLPPKL